MVKEAGLFRKEIYSIIKNISGRNLTKEENKSLRSVLIKYVEVCGEEAFMTKEQRNTVYFIKKLVKEANKKHNGNLAIIKTKRDYKIGFCTPSFNEGVNIFTGKTFDEVSLKVINEIK